MVTIQRTLTVAKNTIEHFVHVENVYDYFETAEVLALPIFPELRAEQLDHVMDSLAAFYS